MVEEGTWKEEEFERKLSKKINLLYEIKKHYLMDPLSAVLIAGGDRWPKKRKRKPKVETEKDNEPKEKRETTPDHRQGSP